MINYYYYFNITKNKNEIIEKMGKPKIITQNYIFLFIGKDIDYYLLLWQLQPKCPTY